MINFWLPGIIGLIMLSLGFALGREFPQKRVLDAVWRAGWRASDGGVAPLNAKSFAEEHSR